MVKRINVTIAKVSMIIKGYECGPGVPKFLVQLTHKVSGVIADKLLVGTAGKDRQISRVYLSDDKGQEVSSASEYLVIQMPVTFDSQKNTAVALSILLQSRNFAQHLGRRLSSYYKGIRSIFWW